MSVRITVSFDDETAKQIQAFGEAVGAETTSEALRALAMRGLRGEKFGPFAAAYQQALAELRQLTFEIRERAMRAFLDAGRGKRG